MKEGDKAIVNIGNRRGTHPKGSLGFIPSDSLADGTEVTIVGPNSNGWYKVMECPHRYVYHISTLIPVLTKKQKLLNTIKDFK